MSNNSGNVIYLKLVRLWLSSILVFLPFQIKITTYAAQWNGKLASIINSLNELTVVFFILLSIGEYYRRREMPDRMFFFYCPLLSCFAYLPFTPDLTAETSSL
jgi:ABC-type uncharacterized transport system permease subunit